MYITVVKRLIDIVIALVLLIVLSPVMLIVGVLIHFKLGSPVIFRQDRPGKYGRIFTMYKFRTMKNTVDDSGQLLSNEERKTSFGSLLRKLSIDELPEFWNILKGDMSLVGPRPLLIEYLELYSEMEQRRHDVLPGLTGWAQVNGRNAIGWKKKFELDVYYVDHINLWLDLKIICMTVIKVLQRADIYQEGEVHVERFKGGNK